MKTMDGILDKIAQGIADALNYAVQVIKDGRKKSTDYYEGLDKKQKGLAKESYDNYNDQYTSLEDTVYEKEDELAAGLADAYKENVDALRESFETIRDTVAAGWIGAAFQAIWGIIKTILKLFEMLMQLLSAVVEAIQTILNDPIGFLMNLIDGVKLGLDNFVSNIKTHLITGLVEWLTGSLGGVGITIPKDLFSLPGIFSLAGQILGLSWDYFRAKAVKKLGEPVVQGIETAVDIFQTVKNEGIDGLWKMVSDKFKDIQVTVMDAIRDMIISKVVEAGIKWIIGLMNPASAFVKAVMMIIDIARFFIERAADIIELVMAFIDGIRALAAGNIQGVAKMIEKALAKAIPILLGFLASLLGITGLTGKVTKIIKKIKGKVDKAINKLIAKAFRKFKKKGGKGPDGKAVAPESKKEEEKKHKQIGQKVEKALKKPVGKEVSFEKLHAIKTKQAKELEKKYQKELHGNVKIKITTGTVNEEKKDNDLDFNIVIAPNDFTLKMTVNGVKDDNFKKYCYSALELVAKRKYKGGKSSEFEKEHDTSNLDASHAGKTDEEREKQAIVDKEKEELKAIKKDANTIHGKISKAQIQYKNASKAKFYPNNTFEVGSGDFFVSTYPNYYIMPHAAAKSNFHYIFSKGENTEESIFEEMKAEPAKKASAGASWQKKSPIPPSIPSLSTPEGKTAAAKYVQEMMLKSNYPYKAAGSIAGMFDKTKMKLFHQDASKYSYDNFIVDIKTAKEKYRKFPKSISDSAIDTVFLASIVAEPARHSVNHISNMLLLNSKSKLDKNKSTVPIYAKKDKKKPDVMSNLIKKDDLPKNNFYAHASMTRGGTDPKGEPAKKFPKDPSLVKGKHKHTKESIPPSQVTDRDLRAILLNPRLNKALQSEYSRLVAQGKKAKTIVPKLAKIIQAHLDL